jgi:hypothetical protein
MSGGGVGRCTAPDVIGFFSDQRFHFVSEPLPPEPFGVSPDGRTIERGGDDFSNRVRERLR